MQGVGASKCKIIVEEGVSLSMVWWIDRKHGPTPPFVGFLGSTRGKEST